jgi:SAM-dependent methyltransferase
MLKQPFPRSSFDIVLSYNVIYHGRRGQFVEAIWEVRRLLKPAGLFLFTCPTRRDPKYGRGECFAPHTYASPNSVTPGDTHYFADKSELGEILAGFAVLRLEANEGYWDNRGTKQFFSKWLVLAEKDEGSAPL